MKCHQCERPALYQIGEQQIPLCVECNHKVDSAAYMQFLMNAAMMNQAADDMDMMTGFSVGGGRIPVAAMARAMQKPATYNNIRISNSTLGLLNTGDLARIDAVITLTKDTDAESIGLQLKMLTEAVVNSNEMANPIKKEMIDLVQALADQVVGARGERKPSVVMALLKSIEQRAEGFVAISEVASMLSSTISTVFGGG